MEGFDRRSCFFTYYNHPYYIDHMAALGYVKDVDWIEELITVPTDEKNHPAVGEAVGLRAQAQPSAHRGAQEPAGVSAAAEAVFSTW